ncbi:MAG: hypothetical protein MZV65_28755 [Chromatiales bacterium]|nr:hypothetical protein [Chromatiales bacterium]
MSLKATLPQALILSLAALPAIAADEELKALVQELSAQVKSLTHRVTDLEQELARERNAKPHSGYVCTHTSVKFKTRLPRPVRHLAKWLWQASRHP